MSQPPQWGVPPVQGPPPRFSQPNQRNGHYPAGSNYAPQMPGNPPISYPQSYQSSPEPPQRGKTGIIVFLVLALMLLIGGGTFFILKSQGDEKTEEIKAFSPTGRPYSFPIPKDLTQVDIKVNNSGPEVEPDIQFSLTSHVDKGGSVIQVGITSGSMANEPIDEISSFVAEGYAELKQFDPNGGGSVTRSDTTIDGHDADVVDMKSVKGFMRVGDYSTYTRFYFISTSSNGPVIFISCDWNDESDGGTQAIDSICTSLAQSIKIQD